MPNTISDFSAAQQESVANLLEQRYKKAVELQLADSELQLDPDSEELTTFPTLYWNERGAHFVVYKTGEELFRCQFFYTAEDQFGSGQDEYDDIEKCVSTLLQAQADHERQLAIAASREGNKYPGPIVISRDM